MHYNKIDPHDIKLHKTHHTAILNGPLFPKPTNPTTPLSTSPIPSNYSLVIISRSSPQSTQKRALQLLNTIDIALGAPATRRTTFFPHDGKIYLLMLLGRVISLVAAQRLTHAFRRLPGSGVETTHTKEKAVIGIARMWTCVAERKRGWCCALLEECAAGFVVGVDCRGTRGGGMECGGRDWVAFSTPSESGMGVARKWTGREDFLVYDD
jgi:ESCO1/2 acetyl-transferase